MHFLRCPIQRTFVSIISLLFLHFHTLILVTFVELATQVVLRLVTWKIPVLLDLLMRTGKYSNYAKCHLTNSVRRLHNRILLRYYSLFVLDYAEVIVKWSKRYNIRIH